ncbi:MAG: glycosyltransferase family 39 protein [Anaerolineae bacterium]|nr:glycosyltransferase family 39 protein [Anaerolineae bacterium]
MQTSIQRKFGLSPVIIIALVLALVAIIARLLPGPRTIDDAFITFRYSRNIVEGQGFVYNIGLPSLGTTTPLFTLLMAVISAITRQQDFQWYAIIVSAIADAITCVLLYLLARRLTGNDWLAAAPGLLWAISPASVTFAVGGMETSVNILWMVAATAAYVLLTPTNNGSVGEGLRPSRLNRQILIGIFAGLGFLTRIDAALWIGPLFLFQLVDVFRAGKGKTFLQRIPWQTWLAFVIVLLPWFAFSTIYFGSPFPRSLSAKTVAYVMPPGTALVTLIQNYATPFYEDSTVKGMGIFVLMILYLILSLIGILFTARRAPRLLPFLLYPWVYITVFSVANPLIFRWYTAPPLPALCLSIFTGVFAVISGLATGRADVELVDTPMGKVYRKKAPVSNPQPAKPSRLLPVVGVIALAWIFTSVHGWVVHPDHGLDRPAPEMAWHKIELYYQDIATELKDKYGVTPTTLVASGDIGVIGYFSRATILDTVGLVTPAVSKYYPIPKELIADGQNYAIPPQLILDDQPQYLVAMEAMVRLGLEKNDTFKQEYKLVRDIPTDFYGTGMYLYQRQG